MRSPSSAEYRKQYGNAAFASANSMLASRRRENPSRGRHRHRRQHRPSRVLRDLLGPGDPATRARHRLLRLLRGSADAAQRRGRRAVRPAGRARPSPHARPRRNGHQPAVHHAADHSTARPPAHRSGPRHRVPRLVAGRAHPPRARRVDRHPRRPMAPPSWARAAGSHVPRRRGRGRNLRIPPARPDRRHRRPRARRRVRGLAS